MSLAAPNTAELNAKVANDSLPEVRAQQLKNTCLIGVVKSLLGCLRLADERLHRNDSELVVQFDWYWSKLLRKVLENGKAAGEALGVAPWKVAATLNKVLNKYGYHATTKTGVKVDEIAESIKRTGKPVIGLILSDELLNPHRKGNRHEMLERLAKSGKRLIRPKWTATWFHYILILWYNKKTEEFYIRNPYGHFDVVPRELLQQRMDFHPEYRGSIKNTLLRKAWLVQAGTAIFTSRVSSAHTHSEESLSHAIGSH